MKIGDFELSGEASKKVNEIISEFLGGTHIVNEGVPPEEGRSRGGKQYRLTVDNNRYVSVKLAYDSPENVQWELFNAKMREILEIPHYKVVKKHEFPLDSWKDKDFIIMDWGLKDRRFHIGKQEVQESMENNKCVLLMQIAQVACQNYLFATSDRKKQHFIWDLDEHVLFSIDHEIPTQNPHEVTNYFRDELKRLFNNAWFDDEDLSEKFTESFKQVFEKAELKKDEIIESYIENGLEKYSGKFIEGINSGALSPLQRIMN